jgi:hypothetical protein
MGMFVMLLVIYFVPTVIAIGRGHRNATPIVLLNILLGWTFLGWVAALIWSASNNGERKWVSG